MEFSDISPLDLPSHEVQLGAQARAQRRCRIAPGKSVRAFTATEVARIARSRPRERWRRRAVHLRQQAIALLMSHLPSGAPSTPRAIR
jgi:hypothetical protein